MVAGGKKKGAVSTIRQDDLVVTMAIKAWQQQYHQQQVKVETLLQLVLLLMTF